MSASKIGVERMRISRWAPAMPRLLLEPARRPVALLAFALVLAVTDGCAPRDPLDRVVEARTLAEMQAWLSEIQADVDPDLRREIDLVFVNLASQTPRFRPATTQRDMHQLGNPLCQRVNGRRLRDVMIDSYNSAITTLSQQNNIDADNLLRLAAVLDTDRSDAFAARAELVKAEIARRDERIRRHRERIEQLRKP